MSTHFNFRVATKMFIPTDEMKANGIEPSRLFSIIEVHYDSADDSEPSGYADGNLLANWEELTDLTGTYHYIGAAFNKPILDLDNWPNNYL